MTEPAGTAAALLERLAAVEQRVQAACDRAGRDRATVRLIAVSKTKPAEQIQTLLAAGQRCFGENRVQEALQKVDALGAGPEWHLIGHLQRNKAKQVVGRFALLHGVDSAELCDILDRRAAATGLCQPILVQANLAGESSKSGVAADAAETLIRHAVTLPGLRVDGLMMIPPPVKQPEQSRRWFVALRELRDRIGGAVGRELPELSMGMTDDFEVAIEEGASLVRVGRAIFGARA